MPINWTNSATATASFTAQVSYGEAAFRDIVADEMIEVVAPAPVRIKLVSVSGFAGNSANDRRVMDMKVDYGERYDLNSHSDTEIPDELKTYDKKTCGLEYGLICDHAMRGTDMSGNQVLTSTYTGGPGPTGTIDQTVTVTVGYNGTTETISFTVRLIHPWVYYLDRDKTLAPDAPETERLGLIFVSRDGDWTGCPAEQAPTASVGGVAHIQIADGVFSRFSFEKSDITNGNQSGHNWGGSGYPECVMIAFKAGETYFTNGTQQSINELGKTHMWTTWTHAGSSANAIIDCSGGSTYDPLPIEVFKDNSTDYQGWRICNLNWKASDYDPTVQADREWWNELKYTNKTGTIAVNTQADSGQNGLNGDILSNGNIACEVIGDDGVDTLIVRQIMDVSGVASGTLREKLYSADAVDATFTNGQTLTNQGASGSVEFVATGSRQDRVPKTPNAMFLFLSVGGVVIDNCRIEGAATGIGGLGDNSIVSDTVISNYWNYGCAKQSGGAETTWGEKGLVIVLPKNPTGDAAGTRSFGDGISQADNRNYWSVTYSKSGEESTPALNLPSHTARRAPTYGDFSHHRCITSTYGGHGNGHQPGWRGATSGAISEGSTAIQISNSAFYSGDVPIQFNAGVGGIPYTPEFLRLESNHIVAQPVGGSILVKITFSNFRAFNNIIDFPASALGNASSTLEWISSIGAGPFSPDPDVNAVEPILDFNTFIARATNTGSASVPAEVASLRDVAWNWSNNAYAIDASTVASIDSAIAAINDDPAVDYDNTWHPLATANSYQSATGVVPAWDFEGTDRPASNVSKGALEP